MVSGIPIIGIIQNERFLSCEIFLLGVRYVLLIYIYIYHSSITV
jgi:hypothetical protein